MLTERMHISYTKKLFHMIPDELNACLKKMLLMGFAEKPDYQMIRKSF